MRAQQSERLTRKTGILRPPRVALTAILKRKLEAHSVPLSIVGGMFFNCEFCEYFCRRFEWGELTPVIPNEVVPQHYISVAFPAVASSCKIEWEVFVLVIGDQNERFLSLPVFYQSVDGGVFESLVIRLYQFRGRFAATGCQSVS